MAESKGDQVVAVRSVDGWQMVGVMGTRPRLATGERRGWEYVGTWRRALVVSDLQPRAGAKTRYLEPQSIVLSLRQNNEFVCSTTLIPCIVPLAARSRRRHDSPNFIIGSI